MLQRYRCNSRPKLHPSVFSKMTDIEKLPSVAPKAVDKEGGEIVTKETEEVAIGYSESIEAKQKSSPLWKLVRLLHAEETGVERITDSMRSATHGAYSTGILFMSINMYVLRLRRTSYVKLLNLLLWTRLLIFFVRFRVKGIPWHPDWDQWTSGIWPWILGCDSVHYLLQFSGSLARGIREHSGPFLWNAPDGHHAILGRISDSEIICCP